MPWWCEERSFNIDIVEVMSKEKVVERNLNEFVTMKGIDDDQEECEEEEKGDDQN